MITGVLANSMTMTADVFFIDVATAVFDDFFQKYGAQREPMTDPTAVRYSTDAWFAEVLYLPSDGPNYSPRVEIGCCPGIFDDPRRNRVDVMHTAAQNSEEYDYNLRWRYQTREALNSALIAVRDRILNVYSLPYLQDTNRLRTLLEQRHNVVEAAWTTEIDEHNDSIFRTDAEVAFRHKDYEKVIQCYGNIPPERRTKIDDSKLEIARNRAT